ncbi:MAG: glutamine-hydrolyzing carbamoyl-phosphate synthase small subunit [Spirochaetia bacterium]|nr:glutamine-hydrolyzing carbamoyl-phosphate synthase small subunit [Spirochaetia bacterium]
MQKQVFLVLDDGSLLKGIAFGAVAPTVDEAAKQAEAGIGEVVFNTGMTGYHEILTDPSYIGQLVLMTYPHIGNYGDHEDWSESEVPGIGAAGLIVRSVYRGAVPAGRESLHSFMERRGIPGISGVDTRALTLKIRTSGNQKGMIVSPSEADTLSNAETAACITLLTGYPDMEGRDIVSQLQERREAALDQGLDEGKTAQKAEPARYSKKKNLHVALIDFGYKANIKRELIHRGCRVTILPAGVSRREVDAIGPDAVLLSNGPGDPAVLGGPIQLASDIGKNYPLFGICLGHQIISLAFGAQTYKMKFGHHGLNHPVRDEESGRVYITSQNHGFAVSGEALLPEGLELWMKNANDQTIEGIRHRKKRIASVQFHPEAAPGPYDTLWVFDEFLSIAQGGN